MHYLKAHSLSLIFSETVSSRDVRISVHLAGRPDSSPLSRIFIIPVNDILHGKTGTGRTDEIAAAAADTSASVRFPYRIRKSLCGKISGEGHFSLFSVTWSGITSRSPAVFSAEVFLKFLCLQICQDRISVHFQIEIIIFRTVRSHTDTESSVAGLLTSHQHKTGVFPEALIIKIFRSVGEINRVSPSSGHEDHSSQKDQRRFFPARRH